MLPNHLRWAKNGVATENVVKNNQVVKNVVVKNVGVKEARKEAQKVVVKLADKFALVINHFANCTWPRRG